MNWKKMSAILGGVASLLAILGYFGLQPRSSSGGGGSSQSYQNTGQNYPVQPTTTRPAVIRTTATPIVVRTTYDPPPTTVRTSSRPTATRTTAGPPHKGTGVVTGPAGESLKVYYAPSITATVVSSVPVGTTVTILCTIYGGAATNASGHTSNLWDRISAGYVADVFIYTGTNDPVAPPC